MVFPVTGGKNGGERHQDITEQNRTVTRCGGDSSIMGTRTTSLDVPDFVSLQSPSFLSLH